MDFAETLFHVQRLLNGLPGVEVVWVREDSEQTRIGMAIRAPESLACLAHVCIAANLLLIVDKVGIRRAYGEFADPEHLRYELRVPKDPETRQPPTQLQIIGIFLARELKARKLIPPEEADQLQVSWNAAVV